MLKLDPNQIRYRGEGNANLVLALLWNKCILRLPKSKFDEKCQTEKLHRMENYMNTVLLPQLSFYIDPVEVVYLELQHLQKIRSAVQNLRPKSRCHKNIYYPAGLLMPDYALRVPEGCEPIRCPILAIEIKPKLGFMPPGNNSKLCRFCLKQHFRMTNREVHRKSNYCPLDLFSGDKNRMNFAIAQMMKSPQNNLRIFKDGELVVSDDYTEDNLCTNFLASFFGSAEHLPEILSTALLHDRRKAYVSAISKPGNAFPDELKDGCCSKKNLSEDCILGSVLKLQKTSQLTDENAADIVESLLELGYDLNSLQELVSSVGHIRDQEELKLLREYIISATAKDLSLIISLVQCRGNSSHPRLKLGEKLFCFKWSVIDLDPKSLNRIKGNVEQMKLWSDSVKL